MPQSSCNSAGQQVNMSDFMSVSNAQHIFVYTTEQHHKVIKAATIACPDRVQNGHRTLSHVSKNKTNLTNSVDGADMYITICMYKMKNFQLN